MIWLIILGLYVLGIIFSLFKAKTIGLLKIEEKMFGLPMGYIFCTFWPLCFDYIWLGTWE